MDIYGQPLEDIIDLSGLLAEYILLFLFLKSPYTAPFKK